MVKGITIEKISVYDGKAPGDARTKFIIRTSGYPQYSPYYVRKDARGRLRKKQMKFRHQYQTTIQLDEMSLDVPFKFRVGGQGKLDTGPKGKARRIKSGRTYRIIESSNVIRGINGDFYWRLSALCKREGVLFGRDWTNGKMPIVVNKTMTVFFPKHALAAIELLCNRGYLK
jgi:hypothetical protein